MRNFPLEAPLLFLELHEEMDGEPVASAGRTMGIDTS